MAKNFRLDVTKAMAASTTSMRSGSATTYQSASFITAESGSAVNLHSPILIPAATASAFPTPNMGTGSLYVKASDYKIYFKTSYGTEYDLTDTGGGGGGDLGEITGSNLLIDGSTSGSIRFQNDGVIYIKDNDATALQVQEATNAYMTFDTSNGSEKVIISKDIQILSTDAGAAAAPTVDFFRNSSSPDDSDIMGKITFTGKDDGGNTHEYAAIQSEINDVTGAGEDGVLIFNILKNASTKSVLELKNNEAVFNNGGVDIDFRIETDDETHFVFIDGNANRMSIGDSTDAPAATFEVTNHATAGATGAPLVQLNSNDTDQIAVDINAANIDADVIDITADAVTTAFVMDITADALTTGGILNLVSDSSDNSSRTLLKVLNDNSSATGTSAASFETHAVQTCVAVANDNAETDFGPILTVNRKSSTVADDMGTGLINFQGLTDGGTSTGFARISAEASDVTDATPQGKLVLRAQLNIDASEPNAVEELMSLGGGVGADGAGASVVINDLSYDVDFRVESDGETHMLFVDGGNNRISIGDSADAPAATLEITNHASAGATGVPLLQLNSNDVDKIALDIDAANTTADVIDIAADAVTTAHVMDVTADGLTTGGILNLVSDSSDTSARTLVTVKNDNTAAVGTVVMHLVNDAIGGFDDPILLIESTANETHPVLELKNSNASTDAEPILMFTRSDTSAEADDMTVGQIQFRGVDSGNNNEYYCQIKAFATDVTAGDEGGKMNFVVKAGGTAGTAANSILLSIGGEDVANGTNCAVIVNEGGINCDFRVESDGEDEAIFLDASAETLYINKGESAFTTQIHNTNDVAITVGATGVVFNEDGHNTNDFRAETTDNGTMFYIGAASNTVSVGGKSSHHDADFAVFNDYDGTTFENKITDGDYGSAELLKYSPGAADTLTVGQLYFLHTDGTWNSTDADAVATGASQMLCVGLGAARAVGVLIRGFVRIPSTEILNVPGSGAVDGLPVYISTTAGHFDFTAPSASGDFVRIVGYAIDDDGGDVLVYFNPDATFVEIA